MQHSGKQYVVRRSAIRIPAIRASTAGFPPIDMASSEDGIRLPRSERESSTPTRRRPLQAFFSEFLVADGLAEPASEDEHTFNTLAFFKRDQGFGSIAPVAVPTLVRNGAATLVFGN